MIAIEAGSGKRCRIFLGDEEITRCTGVWALWNGGPGIVRYFLLNDDGRIYFDPIADRIATGYRFGLRVRVEPMDNEDTTQ